MAKKKCVVGNWKMYKTAKDAENYIETLLPLVESSKAAIYLAVPYTCITTAAHYAKRTNLLIGAQNMNDAKEGAFTGEISGLMLKEAGASFVLLGHSERRHVFGENDSFIHRKLKRALEENLQPILCVGETAKERDAGKTEEVLKSQLSKALEGVSPEDAKTMIVAYEPVWAIGTGKSATAQHIQEAHLLCRASIEKQFGKKIAETMPILYGGSVKPENVAQIISQDDVDGVLVGGASLDAKTFAEIINNLG